MQTSGSFSLITYGIQLDIDHTFLDLYIYINFYQYILDGKILFMYIEHMYFLHSVFSFKYIFCVLMCFVYLNSSILSLPKASIE